MLELKSVERLLQLLHLLLRLKLLLLQLTDFQLRNTQNTLRLKFRVLL